MMAWHHFQISASKQNVVILSFAILSSTVFLNWIIRQGFDKMQRILQIVGLGSLLSGTSIEDLNVFEDIMEVDNKKSNEEVEEIIFDLII